MFSAADVMKQSYDCPIYDTLQSQSQHYIMTASQSASLSWCQAPIWDPRQNFLKFSLIIFTQLRICWYGAPSLKRGRICCFRTSPAHCAEASLGYGLVTILNRWEVNLSLCLTNDALHHEDVWREWIYRSRLSWLQHSLKSSGQLYAPAAFKLVYI
jgi:hypothetical protein